MLLELLFISARLPTAKLVNHAFRTPGAKDWQVTA
jgi:hypothetical protein